MQRHHPARADVPAWQQQSGPCAEDAAPHCCLGMWGACITGNCWAAQQAAVQPGNPFFVYRTMSWLKRTANMCMNGSCVHERGACVRAGSSAPGVSTCSSSTLCVRKRLSLSQPLQGVTAFLCKTAATCKRCFVVAAKLRCDDGPRWVTPGADETTERSPHSHRLGATCTSR
jgi:hypothetical protein